MQSNGCVAWNVMWMHFWTTALVTFESRVPVGESDRLTLSDIEEVPMYTTDWWLLWLTHDQHLEGVRHRDQW